MTSPISEVYNIRRESSACLRMVTCVRTTGTFEHHTVFRDRTGGITDCVVVTMALVSDLSHSENVVLLKTLLTDFVHGKSPLVEPYQRHLATCIIRSPLPHHHVRFHCIRRNLLHLLPGLHGVFLSDLVRVRHDNAFFSCPSPPALLHLSHPHRFRFGFPVQDRVL